MTHMGPPARPRRLSATFAAVAVAVAVLALSACSNVGGGGSAGPSTGAAGQISATGAGSSPGAGAGGAAPARPRTLVAVSRAGALVTLDPTTGHLIRTLRAGGVAPDELALSPDGRTVYFELATGCQHQIWRVGTDGTGSTLVAPAGSAPAISPDGSRLAYATQYFDCYPDDNLTAGYAVIVTDLTTHTQRRYPMAPARAASGLPSPVGHLSWSPDGTVLVESINAVQDNEGWRVVTMKPATDRYLERGDDSDTLPLTAAETKADYFFSEAVSLPDGHLFVVRQCCGGEPENTTSVRLQEVDAATGVPVRQVAVGLTTQTHTSLDVDASGHWLLYLSGDSIEVSLDGARPTTLASGYQAAAW